MNCPIRTQDLSKHFGRTAVLDRLSMEVPEAGIFGLVGPNGVGKTTTIKILMNIFPPTSGRATVLDTDSRSLSPREFARIGYVSENQQLPGWMTVGYFLKFLKPFYPTWDDALARDLVRQFELPVNRKLRHLSRGMRVKAALASALAYRPPLIVLDEPFTGLDALVRDEFIEGLLERAQGITILISSHDLAEIESFASHIGFLDRGRLQFSEELQALTQRFREIEITFEAPPPLPGNWPETWLAPQESAAVIRFVETRFHPERTAGEIRRLFPGAHRVSVNGMSLRSIFVTLAKTARKAA